MLSSAMQVSWQRTLDTLRPAAACAEAVAMKVRNLVLSKKGGICCYSTQCGSADVSGYPIAEGQPAIRPLPPSGPEPFCALRAAGFHSNFLVFGPRTGLFPEILSIRVLCYCRVSRFVVWCQRGACGSEFCVIFVKRLIPDPYPGRSRLFFFFVAFIFKTIRKTCFFFCCLFFFVAFF